MVKLKIYNFHYFQKNYCTAIISYVTGVLIKATFVQLPSHKLFLAMSSPVFHAMFYGEMAEKESVEIKDIEPDAFKGMLQ